MRVAPHSRIIRLTRGRKTQSNKVSRKQRNISEKRRSPKNEKSGQIQVGTPTRALIFSVSILRWKRRVINRAVCSRMAWDQLQAIEWLACPPSFRGAGPAKKTYFMANWL